MPAKTPALITALRGTPIRLKVAVRYRPRPPSDPTVDPLPWVVRSEVHYAIPFSPLISSQEYGRYPNLAYALNWLAWFDGLFG